MRALAVTDIHHNCSLAHLVRYGFHVSNLYKLIGFDTLNPVNQRVVMPSNLADWLIGQGRHFITSQDAANLLDVRPHDVWASLNRARQARKVISVTKGGWVPVPPEYRDAGAPPPLHYIDPLMKHLGHPYYVGFLSAAALHGAAHHPPMVLQVVTTARLRDRRIGGSQISFIQRAATAQRATQLVNTATGRVLVSTSATTVLDLADSPERGGGISNVATVIGDLLISRLLDLDAVPVAASEFPAAAVQRAGWLLQLMAPETGVEDSVSAVLEELSQMVSSEWAPLAPGSQFVGKRDDRWRVVLNTEVEHDL